MILIDRISVSIIVKLEFKLKRVDMFFKLTLLT